MKIGDNIREIREVEKNYKRSFVANSLKISVRAYGNIENNITDITLGRLEKIARIFECSPLYILNYKEYKEKFYKQLHDSSNGRNLVINQHISQNPPSQKIIILQEELLKCERNRIALLEALLKNNKIKF